MIALRLSPCKGPRSCVDRHSCAVRRGDDEIGHLADTLNRMSAEIMKSDQVKKDFLSNISHELRTPLTAIKGWSETILAGPPGDRLETRQGLEVIAHETNRLIGMVEELLDFSRLQSGRVTLDLRPVHVGRLVDEVVRQFAARAREGGLELGADVRAGVASDVPAGASESAPARALRCLADEDRLRQVLINLIDSAVKFTPPGGSVPVEVRVEVWPGADVARAADGPNAADEPTATDEPAAADGLTIAVSDTGCGISPDDLPHVTGKFYKADNKRPGSGLGLSIVDEILRLHGGGGSASTVSPDGEQRWRSGCRLNHLTVNRAQIETSDERSHAWDNCRGPPW